jgi:hypothetical protein
MRLKAAVRNGWFSAWAPRILDAAEASGLFLYLWQFSLFRSSWAAAGEVKEPYRCKGKTCTKV